MHGNNDNRINRLPFLLFDIAELGSLVIQSQFADGHDAVGLRSTQFDHVLYQFIFIGIIEFIASSRMVATRRVQLADRFLA